MTELIYHFPLNNLLYDPACETLRKKENFVDYSSLTTLKKI